MYSFHDLDIPQESINNADEWLHTAYAWDEQGEYGKAAKIRKTHPSQPEPVSIPHLINGQGAF